MPRQARLDAPGTLHHVIIRGVAKRSILSGDTDRENAYGVPLAEIARHLGVTTSAISKMLSRSRSG